MNAGRTLNAYSDGDLTCQRGWGGLDSNQRPADYESAQVQAADLRKCTEAARRPALRHLIASRPFPASLNVVRPGCGLNTGKESRRLTFVLAWCGLFWEGRANR